MRYIISFLLTSAALPALTLPALAEVPRVVTDIPPVHSLVAQVMGDLGQPELLLEKGANAHSFQLRPSQAEGLQEAGLVVWIGPEMTPWLDRALAGVSEAKELRLLTAEGTFRQEFSAKSGHDHGTEEGHGDHAHDEAGHDEHGHDDHGHEGHDHGAEAKAEAGHDDHAHDDHNHDDHAHDDHAGHSHTGLDPHAWLDPANARHWLGLIAAELSAQDPENAGTYAANAEKASAELTALDAEIATLLTPAKDKPLVVFHDAYGYFASHYGLTIAATIAEGDAAKPGAKHIAEIEALLAQGPACLFPEANHDPKLVAQLAEATGLTPAAALDPEGSFIDPGPALYGQMLRAMAQTIADCAS
ncbi:zinc ABC transporter substrate-binding protein [Tabrizicola sp.]|uniref:zinc ABC transporter substrate-binding protein n=1 Tax=Tabrizicola sp. TaxID=2005166 RepID=UPI003D2D96A3